MPNLIECGPEAPLSEDPLGKNGELSGLVRKDEELVRLFAFQLFPGQFNDSSGGLDG